MKLGLRLAMLLVAAFALAGCWGKGKPLSRYSGYKLPKSAYFVSGKGDYLFSAETGGKKVWRIGHPGQPDAIVKGVPDGSWLMALSEQRAVAGMAPAGACQPKTRCLHRLFVLANGKPIFVPVQAAWSFGAYFDGNGGLYGQYIDADRKNCWHPFTWIHGEFRAVSIPPGYGDCGDFYNVTHSGFALLAVLPADDPRQTVFVFRDGNTTLTRNNRKGRFYISSVNEAGTLTGDYWPNDPSPKNRVPAQWTDGNLTDVPEPAGRDCDAEQTWDNGAVLANCDGRLSVIERGQVRNLMDIIQWPEGDAPATLESAWNYNDHGDIVAAHLANKKTTAYLLLRN